MNGTVYWQMQKTVPTYTYATFRLVGPRGIADTIKQLIRSFEQWLMADGFVRDGVRCVRKRFDA